MQTAGVGGSDRGRDVTLTMLEDDVVQGLLLLCWQLLHLLLDLFEYIFRALVCFRVEQLAH